MEHRDEIRTSRADEARRAPGAPGNDPAIGELINERYSILSRIAEGSTGNIYRARDVKTESEVTLKVLTGWSGLDHSRVRQLREELSVTRALSGKRPNIALVSDCDLTADGRVIVVMEPLKGRSLLELIQRREPLPIERAVNLAFQIAEGLHAAHDLGLVHGALGAEHVLVEGMDIVRVVGFEVARLEAAGRVSAQSDLRALSRRANGARPSEWVEPLTEAADTQAVGKVLLELLSRCVRPRSRDVGTLPASVKQLVMHAFVRPPGAPSHDVAALTKALSAELRPRPEPSADRARRRIRPRPRRGPSRVIGAGVLAIAISALVAWVVWSFVAVPRSPATSEIPRVPAETVVSPPPPSVLGPAMPPQSSVDIGGSSLSPPPVTRAGPLAPERVEPATPPPSGVAVAPRAPRVSPPGPERPALDVPPPAPVERAARRPDELARRAPDRGSARPEPEEPDPSAIIDWLIQGGPLPRR